MNLNSGIYVIRHRESGKEYIGRSVNIKERWWLHRRDTESRRDRSPLHRAMRKYGFDAFEWKVLIQAPARLHVTLERQFMRDRKTAVPRGYNVGGAAGGQPCRELLAAMGPEEREAKLAEMRESAKKMHATLALRRQDPEYQARYKISNKETALRREVARRERIASDATYAAKEAARRSRGGEKSQKTLKDRCAADPERAAREAKTRRRCGLMARLCDTRTTEAGRKKIFQKLKELD